MPISGVTVISGVGVYRLSGSLLASGLTSRARYIGSSPAATLVWNPSCYGSLAVGVVRDQEWDFFEDPATSLYVNDAQYWADVFFFSKFRQVLKEMELDHLFWSLPRRSSNVSSQRSQWINILKSTCSE